MLHPSDQDIAYWQTHRGEDRRSWFLGLNVAFLGLAYAAVGLRLVSRLKIGTKVGLDDWLICVAALLLTGHASCLFAAVVFGMGRHAIMIQNPKGFALASIVAQTFYNICTPTIKLSILALYSRIFHRTQTWFTPTLYVTALFVLLTTFPQCFTYIFKCVPISSLWEDPRPRAKVYCINFQAVIVSFGIINILTDWWILALPIPVVMNLQMERRTKWSVCALFLLGGFVCGVSIIRLLYARDVETMDPSWDYTPISLISTIECSAGILAACMPTWRPLFKFLRHGITAYFSSSSAGASSRDRSNANANATSIPGSEVNYGNTSTVSKGWRERSRSRSQSKARKSTGGLKTKINHQGMGTGMFAAGGAGSVTGPQRSETSMSGSSKEQIIQDGDEHAGIELDIKSPSVQTVSRSGSAMGLRDERVSYEAVVGFGRDERHSMTQQQRVKHERDRESRLLGRIKSKKEGRSFYGGVAYGGRGVSVGSGGRDPSLERPASNRIMVTKTIAYSGSVPGTI
ncbi:hypothetical protein BCR34DRAFT_101650 [Clohesyomyces aquaticus]|uniref:Rhodopsin domain-containing protein n=1 Tax=Clohesyomyces aquaticus TaxID=1231657 RepID=A0A1Y1YSF6_9PLEO|nr:hypothetical protein BCR34DRAFT_101650 [Clohesyomyces aquaticus]